MQRLLSRTLGLLLAGLFLLSLLPAPAAANPTVPYCGVPGAPVANLPVTQQGADAAAAACLAATGRYFPEASALSVTPDCASTTCHGVASDYVSFREFEAGVRALAAQYPNYLQVHTVADSYGLCPVPAPGNPAAECTGAKDHFPIYMLEITNFDSPMPLANRQSMLFMLSIHGVEKGGREGGMRVLEDLVSDIGFALEPVQDGAGLPTDIEKPTGGPVQTYRDLLDFQRIFLLFPNADGWMHDEAPYVASNPPSCGSPPNGVLFCRTNGHGTDLNRQAPTAGWQNPNRNVVGEPESIGYYNWMLTQNITWAYAIDVHGMLNHNNFGAIMMPAGALTPQEMQRSVRLAETLKDRLNNDPHFAQWESLFSTGEQAEQTACVPDGQGVVPDGCAAGGTLANAGSSQFAEYYTVIDAIGYTDSGFNGDYFAQDTGLNAPGYDIELAYNHITTESQYEGPGSVFNDFHVKVVREIVKSFMDAAALDVRISFETRGLRTAYVESSFVATSADDAKPTPGGWADENPGDDLWDYGTNGGFAARPAKYFEDLKPFVRSGAEPGVLTKLTASGVTASALESYDQLVIPGSAIRDLEASPAKVEAIKAWAEAGGNLVLTDEAMRFLDLSGITSKAVESSTQYMGGVGITDLSLPVFYEYQDDSNDANRNVRGGVKQTYEPTPLGFETGANAAPIWGIDPAALEDAGGVAYATACGTTNIADRCDGDDVALGKIPLGSGQVQFIGALLPDPTEEFYHPYGLDPYATTYSGNQILRNMLYWGNTLDSPPVVINAAGEIQQSANEPQTAAEAGATEAETKTKDSPGLEAVAVIGALAALALVARRRK